MPETRLNATAALRMSDAEFDQHRAAELARRSEFATHYPSIATAIDRTILSQLPEDVNAREVIIPTQGRNDEEDEKLAEVRKVHRRMAETRTIPATIGTFLPWEVQATGVHLMYSDMTIPACPIGQAYEMKVIRIYKVDIEDKGGRFGADAMTPIAMANDIIKQLQPQKRGGLFHYMGDHLPGENPKTRDSELKAMEKAKRQFVLYAKAKYREAETFSRQASGRQLNNIVDEHRLCFQWLKHWRFIAASVEPTWLTASREEGDIPEGCPACGAESGGGFQCSNCPYVFDPVAAYIADEIDDEHQSLRRLTREQLDELGLEYVMTKDEYRTARRKLALSDDVETDAAPARPAARARNRSHKKTKTKAKAARPTPEDEEAETVKE